MNPRLQFSRYQPFQKWLRLSMPHIGALALAVVCMGCGETNRQVFKRYEAPFAAKRDQLAKLLVRTTGGQFVFER